jgi:hypothetical protein
MRCDIARQGRCSVRFRDDGGRPGRWTGGRRWLRWRDRAVPQRLQSECAMDHAADARIAGDRDHLARPCKQSCEVKVHPLCYGHPVYNFTRAILLLRAKKLSKEANQVETPRLLFTCCKA